MTGRELENQILAVIEQSYRDLVDVYVEAGVTRAAACERALLHDALGMVGDALRRCAEGGVFRPGTGFVEEISDETLDALRAEAERSFSHDG